MHCLLHMYIDIPSSGSKVVCRGAFRSHMQTLLPTHFAPIQFTSGTTFLFCKPTIYVKSSVISIQRKFPLVNQDYRAFGAGD